MLDKTLNIIIGNYARTANKVLPKAGRRTSMTLLCLIEHFFLEINISAETPRLRQYPNRWRSLRTKEVKAKKSIITLILVLFITGKIQACFCDSANIETEDFKGYDEVFEGKILEIKRFEVTEKFENGDEFTFVGTETTFEVIKKWKGSERKIVKILQDGSTCSYQFTIDGYNYLITANNRPFTNTEIKKEMPGFHLMTDVCLLNISQFEKETYDKAIDKLNKLFPNPVEVKGKQNNWLKWLIALVVVAISILALVTIKKKMRAN